MSAAHAADRNLAKFAIGILSTPPKRFHNSKSSATVMLEK